MSGGVVRVRQILHEGAVASADRPRAAGEARADGMGVAKSRRGRVPQTLCAIRPAEENERVSTAKSQRGGLGGYVLATKSWSHRQLREAAGEERVTWATLRERVVRRVLVVE